MNTPGRGPKSGLSNLKYVIAAGAVALASGAPEIGLLEEKIAEHVNRTVAGETVINPNKLQVDDSSGIAYQIEPSTLEGFDSAMVLNNKGAVIYFKKAQGQPHFTKSGELRMDEGQEVRVVHSNSSSPSMQVSFPEGNALKILPLGAENPK